jgi:hypothetical protein
MPNAHGPRPFSCPPPLLRQRHDIDGRTQTSGTGRRSITIEFSERNAASAWERITKVGMVKRADGGPQSTAIFKKRSKQIM